MSSFKKVTCKGDFAADVYLSVVPYPPLTPYPLIHTVYVYTVYLFTQERGEGERDEPERRFEGQQFAKLHGSKIPT
jgi:hypothetical protein